MKTIKIAIFCIFFTQVFGQNLAIDSTTKSITDKLINHGYYEMWNGLPWENSNGMEVPGYTDLDRRIRFFTNNLFEEIVFKDDFSEIAFTIDSCEKLLTKYKVQGEYPIEYLTGKWEIINDTLQVQYLIKYLYSERKFSDCFYLSQWTGFKCNTQPLYSCQYNIKRYFVLTNEQLCFVKPNGGCYK